MKRTLLLLAVCACSADSGEVIYRCENIDGGPESIVKARFYDGGMDFNINDKDYRKLSKTEHKPGVRYADGDGIEFWINGNVATLTSYGASTLCFQE